MWMHPDPQPRTMSATSTAEPAWPELQRARRAIVVVDVVESVRLMQQHEADVIDRWRRFVHEVRSELLPAHGGRLVKSLGDGMLLEFATVPAAAAGALALQARIPAYNQGRRPSAGIHLRLGAHVSEVVVDELDIYGAGVNLAARLASLGREGDIIVSPDFREQVVAGLDAEFEDLGEQFVKHLDDPVHAFRMEPAQPAGGSERAAMPQGATPQPAQPGRRVEPDWPSVLPPDATAMTPAVAVMPFEGGGGQPDDAVVGELVCDGVVSRLARSAMVRVVSRLSSSALRQRGLALAALGRALGADYVVSGRWLRTDTGLLLLAELAQVRSGQVVWCERFSTTLEALLQPEDEATARLADAVTHALLSAEIDFAKNQPLPTLRAHSLHLSAMALMHRSPLAEFHRAQDVLQFLIERHPRAVQPRAWLAQWHVLRVTRGLTHEPEAEGTLALDQTRRALDLDPACSLALAVEGFVHCHARRDLSTAQQRLDLALVHTPNEPLAWLFQCVVQGFRGEGEAAWQSAQRALQLSPLDPMRHYYDGLAASAAVAAGRLQQAVALAERSLRINRNHLPTLRALTVACAELGQHERASATAQRVLSLDPGFTVRAYLERAAPGAQATRQRYAQALQAAGIPPG
jgi:class 3 adenylate cyclase/TolB-like protein/Tfp pilus assembly protein PilF